MARTRHKPEEIVAKLRQFEVLQSLGMSAPLTAPSDAKAFKQAALSMQKSRRPV